MDWNVHRLVLHVAVHVFDGREIVPQEELVGGSTRVLVGRAGGVVVDLADLHGMGGFGLLKEEKKESMNSFVFGRNESPKRYLDSYCRRQSRKGRFERGSNPVTVIRKFRLCSTSGGFDILG